MLEVEEVDMEEGTEVEAERRGPEEDKMDTTLTMEVEGDRDAHRDERSGTTRTAKKKMKED